MKELKSDFLKKKIRHRVIKLEMKIERKMKIQSKG